MMAAAAVLSMSVVLPMVAPVEASAKAAEPETATANTVLTLAEAAADHQVAEALGVCRMTSLSIAAAPVTAPRVGITLVAMALGALPAVLGTKGRVGITLAHLPTVTGPVVVVVAAIGAAAAAPASPPTLAVVVAVVPRMSVVSPACRVQRVGMVGPLVAPGTAGIRVSTAKEVMQVTTPTGPQTILVQETGRAAWL